MADVQPEGNCASTLRVTYTKLAGLTPPRRGQVITINGAGQGSRLFRVLNEPELDEHGSFTIEVEPTDERRL